MTSNLNNILSIMKIKNWLQLKFNQCIEENKIDKNQLKKNNKK